MANTHMVKLGDICKKINKIDPKKNENEYRYIDIGSVDNTRKSITGTTLINHRNAPSRARQIVFPGDLIISTVRPNLNAIALVTENSKPTLASTGFSVIRTSNTITTKYIYHYAQSHFFINSMSNLATGASYPAVSDKIIKNHMLPLPSLEEQERIVAVLDEVKSVIEAQERQLSLLDELTSSLFEYYIQNSTDLHFVDFNTLLKVKSGSFLPAKSQDGGEHPVYGGNGINGSHSQYTLEEPHIIIGRVGAYCGAIHYTKPKSWVTDNALIVTHVSEEYTYSYLLKALSSLNLNQYSNQSGQPSISAKRLKDVPIPIIPIDEQKSFASDVSIITEEKNHIYKALEKSQGLYSSLQSSLFASH